MGSYKPPENLEPNPQFNPPYTIVVSMFFSIIPCRTNVWGVVRGCDHPKAPPTLHSEPAKMEADLERCFLGA